MRGILYTAAAVFALAISLMSCSSDNVTPTYKETRWVLEQPKERFGNTILFDWDYKTPPKFDLWFIVKTALMNPELISLDDEKLDIEHYLAKIFNGVMFYNDGYATAFYRSKPYTGEWKETYPKNVVTYDEYPEGGIIYLIPNLDVIQALLAESYSEEKVKAIMDVVRSVAPSAIPAGYDLSKDKFSLYLTKDAIAPIISALLPYIGLEVASSSIEECINNTDYLKLGLNFRK